MNFSDQFRNRTKQFALRVIKLFQNLPKTEEARVIGKQLLRSSTSVAANYRASCRARSKKEFISKIGIVVEEADESVFWIEIIIESGIMSARKAGALLKEGVEIMKISSTSYHSAKRSKV
jgi:four helix bundle protein